VAGYGPILAALPASAFFGAAFLVACDVLARAAMASVELPVGITS
jgi:ABC-type Fe3+-siderophore transport system permease subunit